MSTSRHARMLNIIWSTRSTCSEPRLSVTMLKVKTMDISKYFSEEDQGHERDHDDVQTQVLEPAPPQKKQSVASAGKNSTKPNLVIEATGRSKVQCSHPKVRTFCTTCTMWRKPSPSAKGGWTT